VALATLEQLEAEKAIPKERKMQLQLMFSLLKDERA